MKTCPKTSLGVVLAAVCLLASNVAAICDNNSIKYSGQYTVTWSGRSSVNAENDAIVTGHETAIRHHDSAGRASAFLALLAKEVHSQ